MTVDVLGTPYSIEFFDYDEKPYFKKNMADGYCDNVTKEIVMCNIQTYPGYADETPEYCRMIEKATLRHEIVHAFFNESGLCSSSLGYGGAWAKNEEMVDWIALQFPKMMKAFESVDAL